jgi:hypothetical protein
VKLARSSVAAAVLLDLRVGVPDDTERADATCHTKPRVDVCPDETAKQPRRQSVDQERLEDGAELLPRLISTQKTAGHGGNADGDQRHNSGEAERDGGGDADPPQHPGRDAEGGVTGCCGDKRCQVHDDSQILSSYERGQLHASL